LAPTAALVQPLQKTRRLRQACDLDGADKLLPDLVANTVLADKGDDDTMRITDRGRVSKA
jgi:hypothetical protein